MDLDLVAVFARVVDAGSFTAAAAQLKLPKSSVSRKVAALEAALGIRLLQRTSRAVALTEAGRAYHQKVREGLKALEEARQAVASLGSEVKGVVRLTAPVDLGPHLAPVLADFLLAHPGVRVEVSLGSRRVDLVKEGFDLAVRAGAMADSSLLSRTLGETEHALFAAPAYLERAGRPRRLEELAGHRCVLYRARGPSAEWRLTGPRGEEQVVVRGQADTDELTLVRSLVLSGAGVALLPVHLCAALEAEGKLERVLPRHVRRGTPLRLVWPSRTLEPAALPLLREALARALPGSLGLT